MLWAFIRGNEACSRIQSAAMLASSMTSIGASKLLKSVVAVLMVYIVWYSSRDNDHSKQA